MPNYVAPTFNLTANIWHAGTPLTDPPDLSPLCQLYVYSRSVVNIDPHDADKYEPPIWLRCPIGTDLQPGDICEVADGSGHFYYCRWVERIHLGFPNEYVAGILQQGTPSDDFVSLLFYDQFIDAPGGSVSVFTFTPVTLPAGLLVMNFPYRDVAGQHITAVDLDGLPLTFVQRFRDAADGLTAECWFVIIPATVAGTITITTALNATEVLGTVEVVGGVTGLDANFGSAGSGFGTGAVSIPCSGPSSGADTYCSGIAVGPPVTGGAFVADSPFNDQAATMLSLCNARAAFRITGTIVTPQLDMSTCTSMWAGILTVFRP